MGKNRNNHKNQTPVIQEQTDKLKEKPGAVVTEEGASTDQVTTSGPVVTDLEQVPGGEVEVLVVDSLGSEVSGVLVDGTEDSFVQETVAAIQEEVGEDIETTPLEARKFVFLDRIADISNRYGPNVHVTSAELSNAHLVVFGSIERMLTNPDEEHAIDETRELIKFISNNDNGYFNDGIVLRMLPDAVSLTSEQKVEYRTLMACLVQLAATGSETNINWDTIKNCVDVEQSEQIVSVLTRAANITFEV